MSVDLIVAYKWKLLHREWRAAEERAREAQRGIRLLFERGRLGSAGPTIDSVTQADRLQRQADLLRLALDAYVANVMKVPE